MAGKKSCCLCPRNLARTLDRAFSKNALIDLLYGTVMQDEGGTPVQDSSREAQLVFLGAIAGVVDWVSMLRGEKVNLLDQYTKMELEGKVLDKARAKYVSEMQKLGSE